MTVIAKTYVGTTVIGGEVFVSVDDLLLWFAASVDADEIVVSPGARWALTSVAAGLTALAITVKERSCPT